MNLILMMVMLNHHNFKLNETVAEDVTLPSLIDGLNTIDYRYEGSFLLLKRHPKKSHYQMISNAINIL